MNLLLFLFTAYGITNIVVFSYLFEPLRNFFIRINPKFLGELVTCPLCFSTWVGGALSYLFLCLGRPELTPFGHLGIEVVYIRIFLDACITSGSVWLIHTVQEYFERK